MLAGSSSCIVVHRRASSSASASSSSSSSWVRAESEPLLAHDIPFKPIVCHSSSSPSVCNRALLCALLSQAYFPTSLTCPILTRASILVCCAMLYQVLCQVFRSTLVEAGAANRSA